VNDELRRLWELRGLDEQVAAARAALSRFDVERRSLEGRLSGERSRVDAVKQRLADFQLKRRQLEKDIDAAQAEERKFQSQLPSVKKNEEYQALLHEIAAAKNRRSDLETRVLVQMDEEDVVQRERPVAEQALIAAQREMEQRRAQADREEAAEKERLAGLERERQERITGLTPPVRARYERIYASREGKAVVAIVKGSCGGCFRAQPPQTLQEARRGDRVLVCDGCGRIVIWPPEGA
jgi:predicted  nucleic acid-binding Zn-ribbon protein